LKRIPSDGDEESKKLDEGDMWPISFDGQIKVIKGEMQTNLIGWLN
jgi:hypothetical protein